MDTATLEAVGSETLRQTARSVVAEYAAIPYSIGEIEAEAVLDDENGRYLLMTVGWDRQRVHGCLIHIDIINDKCWIQKDGTEEGVAVALERCGVPRSQIVLGFKRPQTRALTDYAVD